MKLIRSGQVARLLGITPKTLATWRKLGKGPREWVYTSATQIMYPEDTVKEYLASLSQERPREDRVNA